MAQGQAVTICVVCRKPFVQLTTSHSVCSMECAWRLPELKRKAERKAEREEERQDRAKLKEDQA